MTAVKSPAIAPPFTPAYRPAHRPPARRTTTIPRKTIQEGGGWVGRRVTNAKHQSTTAVVKPTARAGPEEEACIMRGSYVKNACWTRYSCSTACIAWLPVAGLPLGGRPANDRRCVSGNRSGIFVSM